MISFYLQKCVTILCCTPSRLVNTTNKKVYFDVDFDDEKTRPTKAEQSIAKKDTIKTRLLKAQRYEEISEVWPIIQIISL